MEQQSLEKDVEPEHRPTNGPVDIPDAGSPNPDHRPEGKKQLTQKIIHFYIMIIIYFVQALCF